MCKNKLFLAFLIVMMLFGIGSQARANLFLNGDFELGDTGFGSDYLSGHIYYDGGASYSLTTNPFLLHPASASYGDHTTGSGLMMAVNASNDATDKVWYQTVAVAPNKDYIFSAFVSSWTASDPAILDFIVDVNGTSLGTFNAPSAAGIWQEFTTTFNSGANTSLTVSIFDLNTAQSGNDFALDDISLTSAAPVPEPATMLLLCSGLVGLVGIGKRKKFFKK